MRDVCRWGGWAGIYARVLDEENNSEASVRSSFLVAHDFMSQEPPRIEDAIREIVKIHGLSISFGSKHLRFLYPEFCPVLDVNTVRLGYEQTPEGYQQFAQDCNTIATALTERGIDNPFPGRTKEWFVSDIDMALFARLSGWKKEWPT